MRGESYGVYVQPPTSEWWTLVFLTLFPHVAKLRATMLRRSNVLPHVQYILIRFSPGQDAPHEFQGDPLPGWEVSIL